MKIYILAFYLKVKTWFQNRRAKYRRIISGQNSNQNKSINSNDSFSNYTHISDYHPLSLNIKNCNNSPKTSSSSLDLRMHANDINVDGDDDEDEEESSTDTDTILEQRHSR